MAGGIPELVHAQSHAIHHREEQIAPGSLFTIYDATARFDVASGASDDQRRKVGMDVRVSVS
jgi:hypothetical protein